MSYAYGTRSRWAPVVQSMVETLRTRLQERGLTQGQVALRINCHPSTVSRALSGGSIPPRDMTRRIADLLEVDVSALMAEADMIRRHGRTSRADGFPPDGLASYTDLLAALRDLLAARDLSHRELVQRDRSEVLRRSTVGAVLRGERSGRQDIVLAIVRACGVSTAATEAWDAAWREVGQPVREARLLRSAETYSRLRRASLRAEWWGRRPW